MSPLTKALVVLVTFLAVLELGMFVAYSSKHAGLNSQLATERSARSAAESLARAKQEEFAAVQDQQSQIHADLTAQIASLTGKQTEAVTAQRQAETQLVAERARNEKTQASIASLTAAAQLDAAQRVALDSELKTSRNEIVDLRQKNIELTDAVNALTSISESQTRTIRQQAEQLAEANQRIEQLATAITNEGGTVPQAGGGAGPQKLPSVAISGKITQVDASSGTPIVAVNVGANDGVAAGMEFMVHRGNTYLGKLVIDNVDANVSAGRMVLVTGDVKANDAIYAGPIGG